MKRITISAIIDIDCLITFIMSFVTGLILYLLLSSWVRRGNRWVTYLDIPRGQ
jgi:hypothetical protein